MWGGGAAVGKNVKNNFNCLAVNSIASPTASMYAGEKIDLKGKGENYGNAQYIPLLPTRQ